MTYRIQRLGTSSGLALAIALGAAGVGHAQASAGAATPSVLTEVVVTASRTRENIQTVPAAVSALTGADLDRKNVLQVSDLQYATPSLSITSAALSQNVNIRGVGLSSGSPNVVPGVPIYLDWLLQPPIVTTNSFFDIGEVEVYRGPQGTFAGASSTGGAVFITSKSPTFTEVDGNVEVWGGDYSDVGARGAVNLPVNDKLAARVAFNLERRDSFFTNIGGPTTPTGGALDTPGKLSEQDLRLSLRWQPVEQLDVLLKVQASQKDTGGYDYRPIPGTYYHQFAPADLRTLNFDTPEKNLEKALRNSLEIKYELPGGITLRSVTGFQYNKVEDIYDSDASNGAPAQTELQDVSERPITQEFNILSPVGEKLNWILGGFYWHDSIKVGLDLATAGQPPHTLIKILTEKYSEAVFGRVQYNLTKALQLEVGGRWTHDVVNNGGDIQIVIPGLPPLVTIPQTGHYSGDNWTGKVALNYTINDANFLYAFASKGAKAGGSGGGTTFKPETVWSYEAGWKTQLLDRRLRVQLDGFYNKYNDFQVDALDVTTGQFSTTNSEQATIKGVELQVQGRFGGLSLDAGLAYVDSKVGAVSLVNTRLLPPGGNLGPQCPAGTPSNPPVCFDYAPYTVSVEGRSNPYAPKWTYNFGVQYDVLLGHGGTLTPRIDYSFQDEQYTTLLQNPTDFLPSHGIWNARLTYAQGRYTLTGYITNFTDKTYVSGQFGNNEFLGAPRQFGVRAGYKF